MIIENIPIRIDKIIPPVQSVFSLLDIPEAAELPQLADSLYTDAIHIFRETVHPACIIAKIGHKEFTSIFHGEGLNDKDAVVGAIYPRADYLALFALTLAEPVSRQIKILLDANDFAMGSLLDAAASIAADRAVQVIEETVCHQMVDQSGLVEVSAILGYSPGYCGWHISGQKKLFKFLQPEKIGINLNNSYLMTPLKSVTGVLIGGPKEIHIFDDHFGYCGACKDRSCRQRIRKLERIP